MISKPSKGSTLSSQIKQLKKALAAADKDPFLYKNEEVIFMKRSLRRLKEVIQLAKQAQKGGFGHDV